MKEFSLIAFFKYLRLKLIKESRVEKVGLPGVLYPLSLRTKTSDVSALRQIFSHKEYAIDFPFEPKIIIDAGGYIGFASIYFANRFPDATIVTLEPEKSNYQLLQKNVRNYQNIHPQNKAIAQKANQSFDIVDKGYGKWGAVTVSKEKSQNEKIIDSVTTTSIDALMAENHFEHIDILKMDIEGTEEEVFESNFETWLPKTKCLIIELHDDIKKNATKNVLAAIEQYNFTQFKKGENLVFINNNK